MGLPATKQKFKHQLTGLYSKLLPTPCLLCGQRNHDHALCPACIQSLPALINVCPLCALPTQAGLICGQCLIKPPLHDACLSLYPYQEPIIRLITAFKYQHHIFLSRFFAYQLAQKVQSATTRLPKLILPIPLHPNRLRNRGYNQANELARDLAKLLTLPVNNKALIRCKDTQPQAKLSYSERRKNLSQAFKLTSYPLPEHIALIDDVLTTGHTVKMAVKTLKLAGVKQVEVWTIARAIRHDQRQR